jgi:7-cyano-7-deazaguanine synthase
MTNQVKVIAIVSGGLDSTTMVYDLLDQQYEVDCLSFYYGQRHAKELDFARQMAYDMGLRHDVIDLSGMAALLAESGSSLVSDTEVPEGHYAEDNMKATVVPNRNMIMLSIAGGIGIARNAAHVATGVHAGDHAIYPDCRPDFIMAAGNTLIKANRGFGHDGYGIDILAPFIYDDKTMIARRAILLGILLEETWSCYKGGEIHCGRCGTCVERLEAIHAAIDVLAAEGNPKVLNQDLGRKKPYTEIDPTPYEDTEFWLSEVNKRAEASE